MCYDISFKADVMELKDFLPDIEVDREVTLNFDPTEHVQAQGYNPYPVIFRDDGALKCKLMEWGVVTPYMKTEKEVEKLRANMCNARCERIVEDHKSYWHRIRHQRCLIPVTGIFEHRKVKGWKHMVPYFIWLKDRGIFALPGLYNYVSIPGQRKKEVGTFTIITRAAVENLIMKQIHNTKLDDPRMVMFLPNKLHEEHWLINKMTDDQMKEVFSYELPSEKMGYHSVYTIRGGSERSDGKDITEEYNWPGLPPLGEDVQKSMF